MTKTPHILALEFDGTQAARLRQVVCDMVGADLTLVDSVEAALQALQALAPNVVLVPPLLARADEALLLDALGSRAETADVEILITPMLGALQAARAGGWSLWGVWDGPGRGTSGAQPQNETEMFAERLAWTLQRTNTRRTEGDDEDLEPLYPEMVVPAPPAKVDTPQVEHQVRQPEPSDWAEPARLPEPVRQTEPEPEPVRRPAPRPRTPEASVAPKKRAAGPASRTAAPQPPRAQPTEEPAEESPAPRSTAVQATHAAAARYDRSEALTPTDSPSIDYSVADDPAAAPAPAPQPDGTNRTVPAGAERRQHFRVRGPFEGRRCGAVDTPLVIHDVSEGGCFVSSLYDMEVGKELTLAIDLQGDNWVAMKGQVVHSQPGFGFAVRFLEIPEATRESLARLVGSRTRAA